MRQEREGTRSIRVERKLAPAWGFSPKAAGMPAQRYLVLLAMLFAFSWQSFVTQTHQHYNGLAPAAATAQAGVWGPDRPGNQDPSDLPANCPVCREIAHVGPILLPAPFIFEAPARLAFWIAATVLLGLASTRPSHAWQSRAPPYLLQA